MRGIAFGTGEKGTWRGHGIGGQDDEWSKCGGGRRFVIALLLGPKVGEAVAAPVVAVTRPAILRVVAASSGKVVASEADRAKTQFVTPPPRAR